jgi:3',5'-cyclic AMP phosphodiesterase CpdA
MLVLAHLSDPHLGPLPTPRPAELMSKRLLGFLNWYRKRRRIHRPEALAALIEDLRAQACDHLAVTGDLVNIALPEVFVRARAWLDRLGAPHAVTLVPGNHDAYVRSAIGYPEKFWDPYLRGDASPSGPRFPFVRRRGLLALVALSSAVPSPPVMATGALGDEQLAGLRPLLTQLGEAGLFRVVLIHHPPRSLPSREWKRLIDGEAFRGALAQAGAELVLHGHDHEHAVLWLRGPDGPIPAVGVPSASAAPGCGYDAAAYNLYRIDGGPGRWTCEVVSRGFVGLEIGEIRRFALLPRQP